MILHDRTVLQTKDETFALWTLYRYGYRSTLCGTICDYSWLALPLAGYVVMIWGCYIAYAARPKRPWKLAACTHGLSEVISDGIPFPPGQDYWKARIRISSNVNSA